MPLLDPNSGRPIWTGPNGEAGSADPSAFAKYGLDKVQSIDFDGRTHYYIPGFAANPVRQRVYQEYGGGAGDTLAGDGGMYKDPAGGGTSGDPRTGPPNPEAPGFYSDHNPEFHAQPAPQPIERVVDPSQDPSFLAFQRALSVNEENLRADVARRTAAARQRLQDAEPEFGRRLTEGTKSIGLDHASRGTWSSSSRLGDENRLQSTVAADRTNAQRGVAQEESDLQSSLMRAIAANQMQLADQENLARQRLTQRYAQEDASTRSAWENTEGQRYREWLKKRS